MKGMTMNSTPQHDMGQDISDALVCLDRAGLTTIVRRALDNDHLDVDSWDVRPLVYDHTNPVSAGVHRIVGTAHDGTRRCSWSLIHKAVRSPAGVTMPNGEAVPRDLPDGPAFFGYWRREPEAYGAGVLQDLPGGMAAPRCFGVSARPDGTIWLWLEEVGEGHQRSWTSERCARAARVLGRFNGAYLSGRPVPVHSCLGKGWLRSWLSVRVALMMEEVRRDDGWAHPLVRRAVPSAVRDRVLRLWADREVLLDRLDRLQHTFCHRDAFRSNLYLGPGTNGNEAMVAIDWAYAGLGPVGEEIAPLIVAAPTDGGADLAPRTVEASVFDGYLQALFEAGWRGEGRLARFGYVASAALRYTFMAAAEMLGDAQAEERHTAIEQRRGLPIEHVMEQHAALIRYLLDLADEARAPLPGLATVAASSM
jgi:hypothetical protein